MKRKPNIKTCYSRHVVMYDIATGTRSEQPSITKAAAKVGCSPSWLGVTMRSTMHFGNYIVAYVEDEAKAKERLHQYQSRGDFARIFRKPNTKKKVALRIDARTIIYVEPKNANEEYAEQYRQKIKEGPRR